MLLLCVATLTRTCTGMCAYYFYVVCHELSLNLFQFLERQSHRKLVVSEDAFEDRLQGCSQIDRKRQLVVSCGRRRRSAFGLFRFSLGQNAQCVMLLFYLFPVSSHTHIPRTETQKYTLRPRALTSDNFNATRLAGIDFDEAIMLACAVRLLHASTRCQLERVTCRQASTGRLPPP